jgi:cell division protein FtsB
LSEHEAPARPDSLRSVLGAAVLFAMVLLAFASVKSHHDLVSARDREKLLKASIHDTKQRIERLHGRIRQLRGDHDTLERMAREELGLVRPGDVVIVLPAEPPAPPIPRATAVAVSRVPAGPDAPGVPGAAAKPAAILPAQGPGGAVP